MTKDNKPIPGSIPSSVQSDEEPSDLVEAAVKLYEVEMTLRYENGLTTEIDALREARKRLEKTIQQ